jgi:hypothetical protein
MTPVEPVLRADLFCKIVGQEVPIRWLMKGEVGRLRECVVNVSDCGRPAQRVARKGHGDDWAGTRWVREPHIRFGDPCHDRGVPLTPASRCWSAWSIPPGYRKHDGLGLCAPCRRARRSTTD